jgi:hypothetical protein
MKRLGIKEDFTPHMMYDPKTGKGYKADKEEVELDEGIETTYVRMMQKKTQEAAKAADPNSSLAKKIMAKTGDRKKFAEIKRHFDEINDILSELDFMTLGEELDVKEAKFSSDMIDKLKKAYEPMKGKKINPTPLMKIFDKIDSNKDGLEQLYKADIPFVSMMAMSRLMLKHNYKADQINKLGKIRREDFVLDEKYDLYHKDFSAELDEKAPKMKYALVGTDMKIYSMGSDERDLRLDRKSLEKRFKDVAPLKMARLKTAQSIGDKVDKSQLKEEEEPNKPDSAKAVDQMRDDKKKTRIAQLQLQIAKASETINKLNAQEKPNAKVSKDQTK